MWVICTIVLFAILCVVIYKSVITRYTIAQKFKILINCLLKLDKNLKIEYESNETVVLFTSNKRGTITISLSENYGLLFVSMESVNIENFIEKKQWFFIEKMNPYLIFDDIITSYFNEYYSLVFHPKRIKQIIYKSAEKTKSIPIESIFFSTNLVQSSFCLAFNSIKIVREIRNITTQTMFEILLFNSVISYEKITRNKYDFEWQDYINILISYLDYQNLTKQIEKTIPYFEHRFSLYSSQLKFIKENDNPDFDVLYYYMFEKPLSIKHKIKDKEYDRINFEETLIMLISEVEEKTTQLELLS